MIQVRRVVIRTIRREATRLVAVALGLVLVVGVLRGGSHYLYCPFMDAVVAEHCCAASHEDPSESAIEAPDCCETRTIGALPSARAAAPVPELLEAPLVAALPSLHGIREGVSFAPAPRLGVEPSEPPALPRAERAARLMVFLI